MYIDYWNHCLRASMNFIEAKKMTEKCKLILLDEVNCEFENLSPAVRRACSNNLKFFIEAARHTPAFKLGRWDGFIRYFHLNGSTYINLLDKVLPIIVNAGYEIEIDDQRKNRDTIFDFPEIDENFIIDNAPNSVWPTGHPHEGESITLRPHQVEALQAFSENIRSLGEISTGAGKTIISACMSIMGESFGRTLVVVPSRDLVKQTLADYELLGLDVGVYYGSSKDTTKKHTICTWQSLESWNKEKICKTTGANINDFAESLSTIIIDECHNARGAVLQKLLSNTFRNVPIRWGISGTIPKDDSTLYGLLSMMGPIVKKVTAKELMDKDVLSNCNINMIQLEDTVEYKNYSDELKYLISDPNRLDWFAEAIKDISKSGNTVVLFSRIETGEELHSRIPNSYLVHGSIKSADREEAYGVINKSDNNVVLASFGVASTGINIPRIFNLVLIEPGKSFIRVIQSVGRGIRRAKDKNSVEIFDIGSTCKFSKKHFTARKQLYDDANYPYNTQKINYNDQLAKGRVAIKGLKSNIGQDALGDLFE